MSPMATSETQSTNTSVRHNRHFADVLRPAAFRRLKAVVAGMIIVSGITGPGTQSNCFKTNHGELRERWKYLKKSRFPFEGKFRSGKFDQHSTRPLSGNLARCL
jgi:hypothetical protein